jgi:hypothetical protein
VTVEFVVEVLPLVVDVSVLVNVSPFDAVVIVVEVEVVADVTQPLVTKVAAPNPVRLSEPTTVKPKPAVHNASV